MKVITITVRFVGRNSQFKMETLLRDTQPVIDITGYAQAAAKTLKTGLIGSLFHLMSKRFDPSIARMNSIELEFQNVAIGSMQRYFSNDVVKSLYGNG